MINSLVMPQSGFFIVLIVLLVSDTENLVFYINTAPQVLLIHLCKAIAQFLNQFLDPKKVLRFAVHTPNLPRDQLQTVDVGHVANIPDYKFSKGSTITE